MMTASELLGMFSQYSDSEICSLRRTPVLDQLPNDPATFTQIARSFFSDSNDDVASRFRLVSILGEFLYHDGRTFSALLCVVDRAFDQPEYSADGINALARLWCYLNMDRPAPLTDEDLLARFTRYAENEELRHNAKACRELILRRRPAV